MVPLIFDNTDIESVIYNDVELDELYYNGVLVFENSKIISLGNGQSFDVKQIYPKYSELTVDDFYVSSMSNFSETGWTANQIYQDGYGYAETELYKNYNAVSGIFTCYVTYRYTYRDSNGTSPRYYDKKLNVNAYILIKPKYNLGKATSFDLKTVYPDYANLTVNDFYIKKADKFSQGFTAKWIYSDRSSGIAKSEIVKQYNNVSGVLTCYLWYRWDYRDSNGVSPSDFDKKMPCEVIIAPSKNR